jgi:hypothetical protein
MPNEVDFERSPPRRAITSSREALNRETELDDKAVVGVDLPGAGGKVLFIGGYSRSGSTLLDCMLGQLPGVFSTGELGCAVAARGSSSALSGDASAKPPSAVGSRWTSIGWWPWSEP